MAIRESIKNNKKLYEVYVNGLDSNGRRWQRKKSNIESLRKAETTEFEFKRELALMKESKVNLRWEEWLADCISILKLTYRPSTLYSYQKTLDKWVNKKWNGIEIRDISKRDVHRLIFEDIDNSASLDTRKYVLMVLKRVFQLACDNGYLERNPSQGLRVRVPEKERLVLTSSEVDIFLREAKLAQHRFYPIWVVALFTGMRSGELFALQWQDVDFENALISVSKSWNSKNGFTSTKSQKTRVVPISDELNAFLKELRVIRGNEEFVLPHLSEWRRGEAARVLKPFCRSIGITPIKFHDLRATFITNLLARGESLARVMAIVGHTDMETTNVYLRKAGIELKNGTQKLSYKIPVVTQQNVISLR